MKTRHIVFNVLGLTFAFIATISGCGQLTGGHDAGPLLWTVLVTLLIGGGSIANLSEGRLAIWPTISMITGYFLTVFLFPLGVWGIIELVRGRKRTRRKR